MSKITPKECQNIEYKSTWHDKYLEWICGFANAQGAIMYIGVNNDHEVIGLEYVDKLMEDIPNKIVTTMGIVADVNLNEVDILKSKYLTMPISFKGMDRIEKLEVPEEALREILYNAIAHKDYTGAPIQMRVWDDRVEVWNEGELPTGYTQETLFKQHSSRPRNRNIANAFFKAGFIDAWGRGYKKIREGFEDAGLPMPTIESVDGGVKVTFQRNNHGNNSHQAAELSERLSKELSNRLSNRLSNTTINILLLIIADNKISRQQLADKIGISLTAVQKHINKLKGLNVIKRHGSANNGYWEVVIEL